MDEQNRYPHTPAGETPESSGQYPAPNPDPNAAPYAGSSTDQTAEQSVGGYDDHTRPIPPYQQGPGYPPAYPPAYSQSYAQAYPQQPAPSAPRGRGLAAAVLAGALVLGGLAGVGGAAAFHAFSDDSSSTTDGTSGKFEATKTSALKDGTVEKVAGTVLPSVVKVNVSGQGGAGSGSGIVLSKDGEILTNNHVVAVAGDSGTITVNFNDGTTKKAKVVGTDPLTDIAVIKAEGVSDLTPASIGKSSALKVGQTVVAVGSPYGLNSTVTSGIVSALNRPVSVASEEEQQAPQQENPFGGLEGQQQPQQQSQNLSTTYPAIQTDAAINPGNSGGALVDMSGRVVGINSSIRTASDSGSSAGGSIGLGFAIPIDEVLPIVNQITDNQKPTHARLGVSVSDVSGNALNQGAQLQTIEGGGAGAKAGLKKGDVITKVDDDLIDGSESLVATIRGHRPGEKVTITYLRDGKTSTTTADLGSDEGTQTS
jgi:putative serine protease PepD